MPPALYRWTTQQASATAQPHRAPRRIYMAVTRLRVKESPCWVPRSDTTHCRQETSTHHRDGRTQAKLCVLYKHSHVSDRAFTAIGLYPKHEWAIMYT